MSWQNNTQYQAWKRCRDRNVPADLFITRAAFNVMLRALDDFEQRLVALSGSETEAPEKLMSIDIIRSRSAAVGSHLHGEQGLVQAIRPHFDYVAELLNDAHMTEQVVKLHADHDGHVGIGPERSFGITMGQLSWLVEVLAAEVSARELAVKALKTFVEKEEDDV